MKAVEKNTSLPTVYLTTISRAGITFEKQMEEVTLFGAIMGKEAAAAAYVAYLTNSLSFLKKRTAPVSAKRTVFLGFGPHHLVTQGGDTYMQKRIEAAGCRNVAETLSTWGGKEGGLAEVSIEQVLSWNPEVMVIDEGNPGDVLTDSRWQGITAVRNGNVFRLPVGVFK